MHLSVYTHTYTYIHALASMLPRRVTLEVLFGLVVSFSPFGSCEIRQMLHPNVTCTYCTCIDVLESHINHEHSNTEHEHSHTECGHSHTQLKNFTLQLKLSVYRVCTYASRSMGMCMCSAYKCLLLDSHNVDMQNAVSRRAEASKTDYLKSTMHR